MRLKLSPIVLASLVAAAAAAQDIKPSESEYKAPKREYSPYADDHFPTNVFFGDTHLHSSWCMAAPPSTRRR